MKIEIVDQPLKGSVTIEDLNVGDDTFNCNAFGSCKIIYTPPVDDFSDEEEIFMVITPPDALYAVKDAIEEAGGSVSSAELKMIPKVFVAVDEETLQSNQALIDWLEDIDDVDAVYHNMES